MCVMPIDISRHRCLIFGTDGLWNVLTPDAAVSVAHQAERNNEKHYLGVPNSCGKVGLIISLQCDEYSILLYQMFLSTVN